MINSTIVFHALPSSRYDFHAKFDLLYLLSFLPHSLYLFNLSILPFDGYIGWMVLHHEQGLSRLHTTLAAIAPPAQLRSPPSLEFSHKLIFFFGWVDLFFVEFYLLIRQNSVSLKEALVRTLGPWVSPPLPSLRFLNGDVPVSGAPLS